MMIILTASARNERSAKTSKYIFLCINLRVQFFELFFFLSCHRHVCVYIFLGKVRKNVHSHYQCYTNIIARLSLHVVCLQAFAYLRKKDLKIIL